MKKKLAVFTILLILVDQLSKIIVKHFLSLNKTLVVIPSFFDITYVENDGAALNILSGQTIILITVSIIALVYIIKMIYKSEIKDKLQLTTYSLLLGGIIGNIIDRVFREKVIDFLSFHIFSYDFPVFNIADSLIVIGAFLLIISIVKEKKYDN